MTDLPTLRRLLDAATPGPWRVDDRRNAPLKNIRIVHGMTQVGEVSHVHQRDYRGSFDGDHKAADAMDAIGLANAEVIAALRTAAPDLLALIDELAKACALASEAFDDRYDGAEDSGYGWMVAPMQAAEAALAKARAMGWEPR